MPRRDDDPWSNPLRRVLRLILLFVLPAYWVGAADFPPGGVPWWGYRGANGTCISRGAPPLVCDDKTGQNILWKAPMPNWGHAHPLVAQDRVFVLSEGGWPENQDFPLLQCLDGGTGKERWRASLDHIAATPLSEADRKAAAEGWHAALARYRELNTMFFDYRDIKEPNSGDITSEEAIAGKARKDAAAAKLLAMGLLRGVDSGRFKGAVHPGLEAAVKAGLSTETWQHFRAGGATGCFGQCFPTPVTDGKHVYVATAFSSFFCFDLEGKQIWCRYHPGAPGEYCRNGRSPLIHRDLLISDVTAVVRAIDRKTGDLRWSAPVDEETMCSPVVITCGTTDVLLCFNKRAFRLPDGAVIPFEGGTDFGGTALVKHDEPDVVFFTGGGEHGGWTNKGFCPTPPPSAVRFRLDGGKLIGTVLWSGLGGQPVRSHSGVLYDSDRYFNSTSGGTYDALTGQLRSKGRGGVRTVPMTGHLIWLGGKCIYGLRGDGEDGQSSGILSVMTLTGTPVGESRLYGARVTGDATRKIIEQCCRTGWSFNYASAFTVHGDRIYVRCYDFLWCIGHAVRGTASDAPAVVAALRIESDPGRLAERLASDSAQYRYEALLRIIALLKAGAPAASMQTCLDKAMALVVNDLYEEIRSLALRATTAAGKPGCDAWLAELVRGRALRSQGKKEGGDILARAVGTLRALDSDAEPHMARMLAGIPNPDRSVALLDAGLTLELASQALRTAATTLVGTAVASAEHKAIAATYLIRLFGDDAATVAPIRGIGFGVETTDRIAYEYLRSRLDRAETGAMVLDAARKGKNPDFVEEVLCDGARIVPPLAGLREYLVERMAGGDTAAVKALVQIEPAAESVALLGRGLTAIKIGQARSQALTAMYGMFHRPVDLAPLAPTLIAALATDDTALAAARILLRDGRAVESLAAIERMVRTADLTSKLRWNDLIVVLGEAKALKDAGMRAKAVAVCALALGKAGNDERQIQAIALIGTFGPDAAGAVEDLEVLAQLRPNLAKEIAAAIKKIDKKKAATTGPDNLGE